jgi:lysophospholipase L1-like esterase
MLRSLALALLSGHAYGMDLPINPALGVPGYPDCVQTGPITGDVEANARTLRCGRPPRPGGNSRITIGCVGDSITAGAHSSGPNATYPAQLQQMLDKEYPDQYEVTNLGAGGTTMLKDGNEPYWNSSQFTAFAQGQWDIVVVMLGTNDAKDVGNGGPPNWPHDEREYVDSKFGEDYRAMISVAKGLGRAGVLANVFVAVPPPLMQASVYGMNQTVINSVFPTLIPKIALKYLKTTPIDVFTALGGTPDWETTFPKGCTLKDAKTAGCADFCDAQSCDQCHPNDNGYGVLAAAVKAGLRL